MRTPLQTWCHRIVGWYCIDKLLAMRDNPATSFETLAVAEEAINRVIIEDIGLQFNGEMQ